MRLVCSKQHDPQAMGSAITYARRYALQSAMFIPAVDDDGEKAMEAIREDDRAVDRQASRERQSKFVGKQQPVQVSDPSDIERVNMELELQRKPHGNSRKKSETSSV